MPKKVVWSTLAENDFSDILEYLKKEWNENIAFYFMNITFIALEKISISPKQYPLIYKKLKIRKCILTKHNALYYRENKEQIDILRIFDTRQDPKKLKFA